MVLIEFYLIFAVATALTAWWGFFRPLIKEAKSNGVTNTLVDAPILSGTVFILVSILLAPFLVSALIFPIHGEYFRSGLKRVIEEPEI